MKELCPRPPGFAIDWSAIEEVIDRELMAGTPQGAEYHAEGDVWTHTRMVCEAIAAHPGWRALDPEAQAITFAGALFHDLGKPACTRSEPDGRISSRGHSARGETLVRQQLWRAGVPFGTREHIAALVRLHQVPFFLIDGEPAAARQALARLSLGARCDWLALVAEADARGRRCRDPRDQQAILDKTALFVELATESGVLDRAWRFPSDHTRFVSMRDPRRPLEVPVHDETRCEVIVMCGLPGAGKDAWLAAHRHGLPVVALDDIRAQLEVDPADRQGAVIAAARERARAYLRRGEPFAWNATNVSRRLRNGLIDFLTGYPVRVHLVYIEVTAAEQERRNREREAVVPRGALARILDHWAPPSPAEAHRVTHVVADPGPIAWPPA